MKTNDASKLTHYSSEIDANEIWSAIEPRVDELNKKRRKKRLLIWILSMSGSLAVFIAFLAWNTHVFQKEKASTFKTLTGQVVDQKIETGSAEMSSTNNNYNIQSKETFHSEEDESPDINSLLISERNDHIKNDNLTGNPMDNLSPVSTGAKWRGNQERLTVSHERIKEVENNQRRNDKEVVAAGKPELNLTDQSKTNKSNFTKDIYAIPIESTIGETTADRNQPIAHENSNMRVELHKLPHSKTLLSTPNSKLFASLPAPHPEKNPNKNISIGLSVHGGLSAIDRELSARTPMSEGYAKIRRNSESGLEAFNYGIGLSLRHKNGLTLSTGTDRMKINERFDAAQLQFDTTWSNGVKYLVVNLNDDTVQVFGDIPTYIDTSTRYEIYNQIDLIEIPVSLGYEKKWKNWLIGAKAGILVNVSSQKSGKIFDRDLNVIDAEVGETIYRERIGIGYQFALHIERKLFGNIGVFVSPTVRSYPNMLRDNEDLKDRYTLFGGQMGLRYRIN